jgi:hypothetical protein
MNITSMDRKHIYVMRRKFSFKNAFVNHKHAMTFVEYRHRLRWMLIDMETILQVIAS